MGSNLYRVYSHHVMFFIMLCSFSKVAPNKMHKFVKSFAESVDMFKGGFGFRSGKETSDVISEAVGLEEGLAQ